MSDKTFYTTREELRKPASRASPKFGGDVPSESEPA